MADSADNEPLQPSQLGTKDYWNTTYTTELQNFAADPSDVGTIWFSDSAAEEKVLEFLIKKTILQSSPVSWLDLGTGNGHLLFELREALLEVGRKEDKFVGVDYSERSVELARAVAGKQGLENEVEFVRWDIMADDPPREGEGWMPEGGFDFLLDKGTFDAISLSEEVGRDGRRIFEAYPGRVARLLRGTGLFLITSCNWTEEELRSRFERDGEFVYHGAIKYPSFTFGGKKGQAISSVCFRRKLEHEA